MLLKCSQRLRRPPGSGNDPGPRPAQMVCVHPRRDVETREGSIPGDGKRRQCPRHLALPSILLPMSCLCWAFSCFDHLSCFLPETPSPRPRAHTLVPHTCAHTTPAQRRAHAHTSQHTRALSHKPTHLHTCPHIHTSHSHPHTHSCPPHPYMNNTHVCVHTHTHTFLHTHLHAHTHPQVHTCKHLYLHTNSHTRAHTHTQQV